MGTRGAFGVIINEQEKIGYNQFDSYPDGRGVENLRWLRGAIKNMDLLRKLAEDCLLVDEDKKPTKAEIKHLAASTNLGVSEQSTDDWYCLTRGTHGSIGEMLSCGYILDSHTFPFDSLFCEWAYIVDLDRHKFDAYKGFQTELPKKGRWAGRPTAEEDEVRYARHLEYASKVGREPWEKPISEYKAVERVATYSLNRLPTNDNFVKKLNREQRTADV